LEDTLNDWPNDNQQPKLKLTTVAAPQNDSSSLFFRNNNAALPDTIDDTQLTDREPPQLDDNYSDVQSEAGQTELNETTDIFPAADSMELFLSGDPTPRPTMVGSFKVKLV
jgi:hypothetical protein